jgi:hypothetical protein
MTIDEIKDEVTQQSFGLLTEADAVMALLGNGGVAPEDITEVRVSQQGLGLNIAFIVGPPKYVFMSLS